MMRRYLALMAMVVGSWKLSYTTANGLAREAVLELKQAGDQISGTLSGSRGTTPVAEVVSNGNDISFVVVRKGNGDEVRVVYRGTVEADTMRLKMEYGGRPAVEIRGKKQ